MRAYHPSCMENLSLYPKEIKRAAKKKRFQRGADTNLRADKKARQRENTTSKRKVEFDENNTGDNNEIRFLNALHAKTHFSFLFCRYHKHHGLSL